MVAVRINFQQGAKRNLKPMEPKEKHEHKGKNQPQSSSKGNSSNNKAKEKGVYKGKNRLTPEELERYRKDNQCFKCGEQGHAYRDCPQRNARNEQPRASIIEAPEEDVHCKGSPLSYAWGKVREHDSFILFDPGSTHNFISLELAAKPGIQDAMKADGAFIGQDVYVTPFIGKLRLPIQGYVDKENFFISPLKHEDVILGAPWFGRLTASIKFPERKISFMFREKDMCIVAQELGSSIPLVNDQAFEKSINSSISGSSSPSTTGRSHTARKATRLCCCSPYSPSRSSALLLRHSLAMREEVLPSADRRMAGFYLSKADEAAFRECMPPEATTYVKRSLHGVGVRRDRNSEAEVNASKSYSAERIQIEALQRESNSLAPTLGSSKHEISEEDRSKQSMRSLSILQTQRELLLGAPPLQWGNLKVTRRVRGANRKFKPCKLIDDLKTVRDEAAKVSAVPTNSISVAIEDCSRLKNAVSGKRDHPCSPPAEHTDLEESKWEKRLRSSDLSKGKRGVSVQGDKREEPLSHQCITRSSPGKKLELASHVTLANASGTGLATKVFSLPKFVISLSRKEIEEDFLKFKGSKIPKRPKRRPKAAERAINYCTPGTGLSDVSMARYTVKEKRNVKGRLRGLKAMESEGTDSE
ncbi:hypothetical protein L7F22_047741 [Adiantum nelumboides]|nr:hypothetical protein [Adiantum nelumboides]